MNTKSYPNTFEHFGSEFRNRQVNMNNGEILRTKHHLNKVTTTKCCPEDTTVMIHLTQDFEVTPVIFFLILFTQLSPLHRLPTQPCLYIPYFLALVPVKGFPRFNRIYTAWRGTHKFFVGSFQFTKEKATLKGIFFVSVRFVHFSVSDSRANHLFSLLR